jgi:hypothetical protein
MELNEQTEETSRANDSENVTYQRLKPTDGGRDAWQVLTAAFLFEALLWGALSSFLSEMLHYSLQNLQYHHLHQ